MNGRKRLKTATLVATLCVIACVCGVILSSPMYRAKAADENSSAPVGRILLPILLKDYRPDATPIGLIKPVAIAYVSSELATYDRYAVNTINNSGISVDPATLKATHDTVRENMWLSASGVQHQIAFDLGAAYDLDALHIWNYNETDEGKTDRGVRDVEVWVSEDADYASATFTLATTISAEEGGTNAQSFPLDGHEIRLVKFNILTNYGGTLCGLSEVRFSAGASVPPTPTATPGPPTATPTPGPPTPTPGPGALPISLDYNGTVERQDLLEIQFDLPNTYNNPFDPAQVKVDGVFETPSGQSEKVPGFWFNDVSEHPGEYDRFVVLSTGRWAIRYAPREVGTYSFRVELTDESGWSYTGLHTFEATASAHPGTIRQDPTHSGRFVLDDGSPFVALATNYCWQNDFTSYESGLARFAGGGGNLARVWIDPHWAEFLLEWKSGLTRYTDNGPTTFEGLGRYNQEAAYRLDRFFEYAEQSDVYIELTAWNWLPYADQWPDNPYNSANGGPLSDPLQVWTNAKTLQKNYLRYIVARWGWSPRLGILEFWNECDQVYIFSSDGVLAWHNEMNDYVQTLFPDGRLTTTSFAWTCKADYAHLTLWGDLNLDVVQCHNYGGPSDLIDHWGPTLEHLAGFGRPFGIQEFSATTGEDYDGIDPEARNYHLGIWIPTFLYGASSNNWQWKVYHAFDLPDAHLAQLAAFDAFVDLLLPELPSAEFVRLAEDSGVAAGGYLSSERAAFWFYNKAAYWNLDDTAIGSISGHTVTLNMAAGSYTVDYWDPYTGQVIGTEAAQSDGSLTITLPTFKRDVAVRIHP